MVQSKSVEISKIFRVSPLALCTLAMSLAAAHAQDAPPPPTGPMEVVKYVDIQPGQEKAALAALKTYSAGIRKEDGNMRAGLLQEDGRPWRFAVFEKWKDAATYTAHLGAPASKQLDSATAAILRAPNDERASSDFLAQDGGKPQRAAVFVATHVDVNPPNRPKTEDALKLLVDASRKDPGSVEFNVFRPQKALNHFTLFEVWSDTKSFDQHVKTPAAIAFRQTIAPLIGALYDERVYKEVE